MIPNHSSEQLINDGTRSILYHKEVPVDLFIDYLVPVDSYTVL